MDTNEWCNNRVDALYRARSCHAVENSFFQDIFWYLKKWSNESLNELLEIKIDNICKPILVLEKSWIRQEYSSENKDFGWIEKINFSSKSAAAFSRRTHFVLRFATTAPRSINDILTITKLTEHAQMWFLEIKILKYGMSCIYIYRYLFRLGIATVALDQFPKSNGRGFSRRRLKLKFLLWWPLKNDSSNIYFSCT